MKKKFNFIDVIIVIFVISALSLSFIFFSGESKNAGDIPSVSFTVEFKEKDPHIADLIEIGADVKDSIKGGYYGKVTDIKIVENSKITQDTINGEFKKSSNKGKVDAYITITGTPSSFGDDIMFASQSVKIGKEVYLKSKEFAGYGYVVKIDINDK